MIPLKKLLTETEFAYTAYRFFLVGILLFILPYTRTLFVWLIPWVLLISLAIMLAYHRKWNVKTILIFLSVYLLSFLLEMAGTADPRIFGAYRYGQTLGIQLNHTPLLIGLNWLMLVYSSHAIVQNRIFNPFLKITAASILMVLYDVVIEVAAPATGMWAFDQPYPPLRNFISWFIAAFVFHSLFTIFGIRTVNRHAVVLFFAQLIFFALIDAYILIRLI